MTSGYISCPVCGDDEQELHARMGLLRALCLSVFFTMPLLWDLHPYIQLVLASLIQFWPGQYFYRGALHSLRQRTLGMDFLVALSTTIIYIYSAVTVFVVRDQVKLYFLSEGVLLSLILFGKYLESTSRAEAASAIRKLICLQPQTAAVLRDGCECEISIADIQADDIVLIHSGDRVPVDGRLLHGRLLMDESMLTGESELIAKAEGDPVYCGTLNRDGEAQISISGLGSQTMLQQIIDIVANAQQAKAPIQRFTDKVANLFVPTISLISVGVFFLWYLWLAPQDIGRAVSCVCSTLVIACPCALGLATPTGIMVGSGRAAELGVLFRDGSKLENAHRIDTVVFDKTGTLTSGTEIREDVKQAVAQLKEAGIALFILSGDREEITRRVAEECGIDHYIWGVKPAEKAEYVERLRHEGRFVAMAGDGINDAPALVSADIGIAMASGTDIAIDSADILLLNGKITGVPKAIRFSRSTMKLIKANLLWALLYNLICIPAAAAGMINPSMAAAAMSLSSNGVLLNSLRLKKMQ